MAKLIWNPQPAFKPYFNTAAEVKKNRSVFRNEYTYFVSYGGRGSGKSVAFTDALVVEASLRPVRVLIARQLQNSIKESTKKDVEEAIKARGLENFFQILETEIRGLNGSKFIFRGLQNNINNIKSISDVDCVLCEESEAITEEVWSKLLPSIRPKSGKRPIIAVVFNPGDVLDPTYQRWVENIPDQCISQKINWSDNIYFPDFLNEQRLNDKRTMPLKHYNHIWEGEPLGSADDVIIDLDWIRAARFASQSEGWQRVGKHVTGFDPSGQGRDYNATADVDGNCLIEVDEWLKSPDLRDASERAFGVSVRNKSKFFVWDDCGGLGNGVSVFVGDAKAKIRRELIKDKKNAEAISFNKILLHPFNAGDGVHMPDAKIKGTKKTNGEIYSNLKAQTWGIAAQRLYNTYRFVVLGERDIDFRDMLSIDIEDDATFNKLAKELSTPIWVKSNVNSKKKVESKDKMQKRTGQPSPNIADALIMTMTPKLPAGSLRDIL
ncbi:terminase large subunit [Vibrio phage 466E53-1]|nr:terminase large subunit [Vibrio phage 466E53-1]